MSNFSSRSKIISTESSDSRPKSSSRSDSSTFGLSTRFFLAIIAITSLATSLITLEPPSLLVRSFDRVETRCYAFHLLVKPFLPPRVHVLLQRAVMRDCRKAPYEDTGRHVRCDPGA